MIGVEDKFLVMQDIHTYTYMHTHIHVFIHVQCGEIHTFLRKSF